MFTEIFHYVGGFIKYVGMAAVFVLSVSLAYLMFSSIAPDNMPWFTWAAMGLTEGGLLCWLAAFRMQKHHDAQKALAFVMIFICLIAVGYTDAMELAKLFHQAVIFAGMYYYALIALLLCHFGALIIDEMIKENEKYNRQHSIAPPPQHYAQHAYAIRNEPEPVQRFQQVAPVPQLASGGETVDPLAVRQRSRSQSHQPKEEPVTLARTAAVAPAPQETELETGVLGAVKEGASTLMQKATGAMKTGLRAGRVPGKTNGTISASTSSPMDSKSDREDGGIEFIEDEDYE